VSNEVNDPALTKKVDEYKREVLELELDLDDLKDILNNKDKSID
jgi:hypothetical protein